MATQTTNYKLIKPDETDFYDVSVQNGNMDKIDAGLKEYAKVVTVSANGLMSKEDKVKLNGVAASANNYVHPSTHPATMISPDSTHRFVTDSQKSVWDAKADNTIATTVKNGLMSKEDKVKLDGVDARNAASATKLQTARGIDGVNFDGTASRHHFTTCSTSAGTAAKTASLLGFTLVNGAKAVVKFTYGITAVNPTLNIGSTGAKAIYYKGSPLPGGYIQANAFVELQYDGTRYNVVGDLAQTQVKDIKDRLDEWISPLTYLGNFVIMYPSKDLNDAVKSGYMEVHIGDHEDFTNIPSTVSGLLIVFKTDVFTWQIYIPHNISTIAYRGKWLNNNYTPWKKVTAV